MTYRTCSVRTLLGRAADGDLTTGPLTQPLFARSYGHAVCVRDWLIEPARARPRSCRTPRTRMPQIRTYATIANRLNSSPRRGLDSVDYLALC